jgi:hypothetical protein
LFAALSILNGQNKFSFPGRDGEFLIDSTYSLPDNDGQQLYPAVAFDGVNCLVVWTDYRYGIPVICGSRVNASGTVIDTISIPISSATSSQDCPAVAFDGTNYLVVWREQQRYISYIYGTRISPDGTVLDPNGIKITDWPLMPYAPKIAFDGTNYLIVWKDSWDRIYAKRVTPGGSVLDPGGICISWSGFYPSVIFGASDYLVVWTEWYSYNYYTRVCGARVTTSGVVLDTVGIVISNQLIDQQCPCVAFDGVNFLVAWEDLYVWDHHRIRGSRVNQAGQVLDSTGFIISPVNDSVYGQRNPGIDFNGTNYLVVWQEINRYWDSCLRLNISGARVSPVGAVLDPQGIAISSDSFNQVNPAVAFAGSDYMVVWQDGRKNFGKSADYDIYCARVTPVGSVLDPHGRQDISSMADRQSFSSAAFDGTNYLVVWQDYDFEFVSRYWGSAKSGWPISPSIYGIRIDNQGLALDSIPIEIGHYNGDRMGQTEPAVAFNGSNYLVVWGEEYRQRGSGDDTCFMIVGARVSPSGELIDTVGFKIIKRLNSYYQQDNPTVASNGINYMVVWDYYNMAGNYDLFGARVTSAGQVLDTLGIEINNQVDYMARYPKIAFDGTNYLVVWEDERTSDIYGCRVTPGGAVLDPYGFVISSANNLQSAPTLAFDGTNYLVVWQDYRNTNGWLSDTADIYGSRVTPAGAVLDPSGIAICVSPAAKTSPKVAFDGTNYVVVWEYFTPDSTYDLCGARISTVGQVISTFTVVSQGGDQTEPSLVQGNGGQILTTYTGWTPQISGHSTHTTRIWGKLYPFAGVGETDWSRTEDRLVLDIRPNPGIGPIILSAGYVGGGAKLKIYDATGRLVRILILPVNRTQLTNSVFWDGTDDCGAKLPAGAYFIQLRSGDKSVTRKVVLTR